MHFDCVIGPRYHTSPFAFLPRWSKPPASPFSRYLRKHGCALGARPAGREAAITTGGRKEKVSFLRTLPTLPPTPEGSQAWPGAAQGHDSAQAWRFSGKWAQQLSPQTDGEGAASEQADVVQEPWAV